MQTYVLIWLLVTIISTFLTMVIAYGRQLNMRLWFVLSVLFGIGALIALWVMDGEQKGRR